MRNLGGPGDLHVRVGVPQDRGKAPGDVHGRLHVRLLLRSRAGGQRGQEQVLFSQAAPSGSHDDVQGHAADLRQAEDLRRAALAAAVDRGALAVQDCDGGETDEAGQTDEEAGQGARVKEAEQHQGRLSLSSLLLTQMWGDPEKMLKWQMISLD